MDILIRKERENDITQVSQVIKLAFESAEYSNGDEHHLVNRLRKSSAFIPELSLVAQYQQEIIGHILFTKIKIDQHTSLALAPLAVLPAFQRKGVGKKLILEGHRIARELGYSSVIVLGHPTYYSQFGYTPASKWNIKAPFDIPNEVFMAIELVPNSLKRISGKVEYAQEFFLK
ncbi:MAG: N-acetyltransferase [Anoxybacillus sp.]|nr:N-acetyltransferase [Anoxybacillus sp.]MCL6587930.1 N-acetyltransferase [Anoxybacillus sp.]